MTAGTTVTAVVVGLVIVLGGAGTTAVQLLAQESGPEDLARRLREVEQQLPAFPPDEVILAEDQTWAQLPGNYRGAEIALEDLADQLQQLFVDASESSGEVATAVADVSRALLVLREGYGYLADWEEADLEFPLDAEDDLGVATGADDLRGEAETGLAMLLDAAARRLPAYDILSSDPGMPPDLQGFFSVQLEAMRDFDEITRPRLHRALSLPTTQILRPIDRFETVAPGVEARARSFQFVCIDREAYLEQGLEAPADLPEALAALDRSAPSPFCSGFDNGNQARLLRR